MVNFILGEGTRCKELIPRGDQLTASPRGEVVGEDGEDLLAHVEEHEYPGGHDIVVEAGGREEEHAGQVVRDPKPCHISSACHFQLGF